MNGWVDGRVDGHSPIMQQFEYKLHKELVLILILELYQGLCLLPLSFSLLQLHSMICLPAIFGLMLKRNTEGQVKLIVLKGWMDGW